MKIILMAAVTLDGKIAKDAGHFVDWTSREDKRLFFSTSRRAGVIIMGHNTYKTLPSPLPGRLHIVLTTKPAAQETRPGEVEFTADTPQEIVRSLEERGYREAVLIGGAQANTLFLKSNLVDELWLTVEPLIFGDGIGLFAGAFLAYARLLSVERLNEAGSVLLRYALHESHEPPG